MKGILIFLIIAVVTVPSIQADSLVESVNKLLQSKSNSIATQPLSVCSSAAAIAASHKYCNCWISQCPCNGALLSPIGLISSSFSKSGLEGLADSVDGLYNQLPACKSKITPGTYTSTGPHTNAGNTWKIEIPPSEFTSGGKSNEKKITTPLQFSSGITWKSELPPSEFTSGGTDGGVKSTYKVCDPNNLNNCEIGDLLFYCSPGSAVCPSHVAMHVGDGLIAECPINSYQCTVRKPVSENYMGCRTVCGSQ